ncbi:DNA-binding response regulator, OmpR family, contains REC and winged-helix (wHTH) domain [Paenibacillus sp. UNCCL117]|uniref:response regulator transcription factor n=1 Tax=unclassified Paenibacillus TaxID=185978 RepID=UPI00088D8782|nr:MULTISPECIES: response regulator transcription factor [unclassified Paenibacillus]SDC12672.1 DNA-binding response regulator, OmpR family, contains REC and winged-helix (wHTH) domain [Paenibacillus sp. cl123]SFW16873.1 DNA-binding response regulator, OmpR family, contains REC and winged-helix (wHTH) domain [Paenibacillus sp. UNCCL117]
MKPVTILIAEDDAEIADLIELYLNKEGYHCIKAADGQAAVDAVARYAIDLAILDIMMPRLDGHEVTRQIRDKHVMPIIFLSAKGSDLDKITGLIGGADDYMTKPFNPMELVARVKAQLRRSMQFSQPVTGKSIVEAGGLVIHPDERTVICNGVPVELTPKEFDILHLLASAPKRVYSSEQIFKQVWGEDYYEGNNTVMVHIRTLRKKLGDDIDKNKWVKTVWGVGYTFNG